MRFGFSILTALVLLAGAVAAITHPGAEALRGGGAPAGHAISWDADAAGRTHREAALDVAAASAVRPAATGEAPHGPSDCNAEATHACSGLPVDAPHGPTARILAPAPRPPLAGSGKAVTSVAPQGKPPRA